MAIVTNPPNYSWYPDEKYCYAIEQMTVREGPGLNYKAIGSVSAGKVYIIGLATCDNPDPTELSSNANKQPVGTVERIWYLFSEKSTNKVVGWVCVARKLKTGQGKPTISVSYVYNTSDPRDRSAEECAELEQKEYQNGLAWSKWVKEHTQTNETPEQASEPDVGGAVATGTFLLLFLAGWFAFTHLTKKRQQV